ncbi:MAG: DUF3997 domain-containing protein [Planctomycetota bacterium]|jgi:hypothetical protein
MRIRLLLAGLLAFLPGCPPGAGDFSAKLCGDYYVRRTSAHQIHVSPNSWTPDTPRIPPKVVKLGHDDRFIIAEQNHLKRRSPNNPNDTYMEPNPGVYSYWILDVSIPKAFGPFSRDDFDKKRGELGVPNDLAMKGVYSYRE